MPENDAHIPGMNAVSFVAYCGELAGLPRVDAMQRAHEVLFYVGLGEARYRNVETYSTGMKQRIKLAQALVHDPDLLFLDEPTNGMDPKGRDEMLELVRDLAHNKGVNLILSLAPAARRRIHLRPRRRHGQGARSRPPGPIAALKQPRGRVFELRVKTPGDLEPFVERLRAAGLECHATDEDVDARVRARRGRRARAVRAGRRRARAGAAPAAERADARRRVRARGGRGRERDADSRSGLSALRRRHGAARARRGSVIAQRRHPHACSAKRAFLGLLLLSWLPFLVRAVQIYAAANLPQAAFLAPTRETFRQFLDQQDIFVFFVTVYVGAGLIANDRRANALQIYLSKPLTRAEYIFGKLAILMTFLLLVTWVPAILLLIVQIVFAGNFTFFREQPVPVPGDHACSSFIQVVDGRRRRCWRCRRCRRAAATSAILYAARHLLHARRSTACSTR